MEEKINFDAPPIKRPSQNSRIKTALFKNKKKPQKTEDEGQEVKRLKKIVENNVPEPQSIKKFQDLPISRKSVWGLKEAGYVKPTEIQRESIGLALRGLDILGAAKTGSGKTLAFIIPVLEKLFLNLWTPVDGLGAIIITPTRELAYQIFETLRNVGRKHDFSAGLIIGGKDLKFERKRVDQMNIIICTPGRLLQHMDENPHFDCSNVQILVLDEADRCLDMGFERDMNAIIDNLPIERQTLLFSATQTKSVKDLARLSLKSPVFVSVHENAQHSTPETLQQSYIVCPLENKLDMLWSFIKHHKKSKIIVFLSSCKQVRFVHLLFCRMRPGTSVLALYGSLHQLKRMSVYDEFCKKQAAVLFATDIAARGLDFPSVDWVLQLDCPEDTTTYIHRAGRTARYNSGGEALLLLQPFEEASMAEQLVQKKIPIQKIEVNQRKFVSVRRKFESLLARDMTLKECAQRAFKAYIKSVFLMKDKSVFDITSLDLDAFAGSLGLAVAPRVRFLENKTKKSGKKSNPKEDEEDLIKIEPKSESDVDVSLDEKEEEEKPKYITQKSSRKTLDFSVPGEESSDDGETLFKSKKPAELELNSDEEQVPNFLAPQPFNLKIKKPKSKAAVAKKLLKKKILTNKKLTFDEEGSALPDLKKERQSQNAKSYEREDISGIDIERAKEILQEEDQYDKQIFRERIRAKHREERLKKKLARKGLSKKDEEAQEVHVGGEFDENNDSSDSGPNLDWLPDPDKIYGKEKEEEEEEEEEEDMKDDMEVSSEEEEEGSRKRVLQVVNSDSESEEEEPKNYVKVINRNINSKKRKLLDKSMDKGLMEEFALKLLSK